MFPVSRKLTTVNPKKKLLCRLLSLGFCLLLGERIAHAAETIRLTYTVEYDPAALHTLKVSAKILGLPAEAVPAELPESHVTDLAISTVEGGEEREVENSLRPADASLGRSLLLHGKPTEPVFLKFKVALNERVSVERHSSGDGKRCIVYASDFLLGFNEQNVRSLVSFDLPSNWIVVSSAKTAGKDRYIPGVKAESLFYLGPAVRQSLAIRELEVSIALEAKWQGAGETWVNLLNRQLAYRAKVSNDGRIGSFLVVLLEWSKNSRELKIAGLPNGSGILAMASSSWLKEAASVDKFQQEVTRALLPCFFPNLRMTRDASAESYLLDYLSLKSELKTGMITKEQFFQEMATGFGVMAGGETDLPRKLSAGSSKTPARDTLKKEEKVATLFLFDLLLGFYGKAPASLEQLVQTRGNLGLLEKLLDGEPPRTLSRDSGFLTQLETVFPRVDGDVPKRLRPFGLVFEKRELADFSFDLDENFIVERVSRKKGGGDGGIHVGDKVMAVGERKLLRPIDLTMVRSEMHPGTDIQLMVERDGSLLKIKEHVGVESVTKLEANRLSDADKQEKLEVFLSRDGNG